jgi:hypothetical protein
LPGEAQVEGIAAGVCVGCLIGVVTGMMTLLTLTDAFAADSDEVAQAFRNDVARRYEMMPPSVPT